MSVTPESAPYRPAYARDAMTGLYYRIGGGGSPGASGGVYVGTLASAPAAADYSQWVVTDDPEAYALQVSDGSQWYPIAGGVGEGGGGEPERVGPITFTTKGSTFAPKLWQMADSPNEIEWINSITSTTVGTGPTPTINFGSTGTRNIEMWCNRPQDVLTVNVGYNTGHDTGNYLPGASGGSTSGAGEYNHSPQRVTAVTGLQLLPNLVNFMAAGNPEDPTLGTDRLSGFVNFSGLSKLEFIECAYARISSTDLTGCTSLIRLCFEENQFQGNTLDLNPVRTNLRDIRMAFQGGVVFTPLSGPLTQLYHLCVRAQPITNMPVHPNIPVVSEHWTWDNGQSGTFVVPPQIYDARVDDNSYTSIDLTLTPGVPSLGRLAASRNPLTSITGLATGRRFSLLELVGCGMTQTLVNQILANVNSWGTSNGGLHLTGSASPTGGQNNTDRLALVSRGWTVVVA